MTGNIAPETKMPYWRMIAVVAVVVFFVGLGLYPRLPEWASVAPGLGLSLGLLFATLYKLILWRCHITGSHGDDNIGCVAALVGWVGGAIVLGFATGVAGGVIYFVSYIAVWATTMLVKPAPT